MITITANKCTFYIILIHSFARRNIYIALYEGNLNQDLADVTLTTSLRKWENSYSRRKPLVIFDCDFFLKLWSKLKLEFMTKILVTLLQFFVTSLPLLALTLPLQHIHLLSST